MQGDEGRFVGAFVKQFESAEWTSLQARTATRYGGQPSCYCLAARTLASDRIVATADLLPPYAYSQLHPKGVPQVRLPQFSNCLVVLLCIQQA